MSAEPLPAPDAAPARNRRAEGLSRSVLARPVLSLVPTPVRARRAPFVALVLGILLAGLVGLLLLNTASAQDAFRLHRLEASAANAADAHQALSQQVNTLTGPEGLAAAAQRMGMVPMGPVAFWKPGEPLPPGARVVDGMVVVPANAPQRATPTSAPSAPTNPDAPAVRAVPRPGQQTSTSTKPPTKASASTQPSTSTKPSTTAKKSTSSGSGSNATTKGSTKPPARSTAAPTSQGTSTQGTR